jgi:LmbE family N-acetylglucosaminyl deacetylase
VLRLQLGGGALPVRRVLAIGCHADDIEIGCGATLLSLVRSTPGLEVSWVVLSAAGGREQEARAGAAAFGGEAVELVLQTFRDGFLPYVGDAVKDAFEDLKRLPDPDLVLTHAHDDLHQDHRLVNDLTWNTFRNHLILEYEIPKYDGDLGRRNVYVPVSEEVAREKVELVANSFPSQAAKDWFDEGVFLGLMRLRGMEARSPSGYAEAFTCRKLVLGAVEP